MTTASSRQSSRMSANSLGESHPQQSANPSIYHAGSSIVAGHPNVGYLPSSYGNSLDIETHGKSETNVVPPRLVVRGIGRGSMYAPPRRAPFPANSSHSGAMFAGMSATANVIRPTSATEPSVSQSASALKRIPALANALPQSRAHGTNSEESATHMKKVLYECTHCTETFRRAGNRNRHHEEKHDALYLYKCKQCPSNAKHYDSFTSIRRHLSQAHDDQSSSDYRYPERRQYRRPNTAMACGLCGELFRRMDWTARATPADKTRRAARRAGSVRTERAIFFQQDEQEDEMNQDFLEFVWYNHISTAHHGNLSGWSRRTIVDAFLRQDELRQLFEFAILHTPISPQWMTEVERIHHWNDVLGQRVNNDVLWDKILEQLEFYSLSGNRGDAKKTVELCIGLDLFDWTLFDWASGPFIHARNNPVPEADLHRSQRTVAAQTQSSNSIQSSLVRTSGRDASIPAMSEPFREDLGSFCLDDHEELDFNAFLSDMSPS